MQEYNGLPSEFGKTPNFEKIPTERPQYVENSPQAETKPADEFGENIGKKSKRAAAGITTLCAGVLAASVTLSVAPQILTTPVDKATVELVEFGVGAYELFYHVNVECEVPLEIVVYNRDYEFKAELLNGGNGGAFEELLPGQEYTFAVRGTGKYKNEIALEKKIRTLDLVDLAIVNVMEFFAADGEVSYHIEISSDVPLELVIRDGTTEYVTPLINGENPGQQQGLSMDKEYTFLIRGEATNGTKKTIYEEKFIPAPYTE